MWVEVEENEPHGVCVLSATSTSKIKANSFESTDEATPTRLQRLLSDLRRVYSENGIQKLSGALGWGRAAELQTSAWLALPTTQGWLHLLCKLPPLHRETPPAAHG